MSKPFTPRCRVLLAWAFGAGSIGVNNAWAELPTPPSVEKFSRQQSYQATPQQAIGRIELVSGKSDLLIPARQAAYPAKFGTGLSSGDVIETGPDGRCRIVLGNGDVVHLGPGTLAGVEVRPSQRGGEPIVNLWRGQLIAYAMPTIQGREQVLVVQAPAGNMELGAGKAAVSAEGEMTRLAVFDNVARWIDKTGARRVVAGEAATTHSDTYSAAATPLDMEAKLTAQASPEVPVVTQGLETFRQQNLAAAKEIFSQVQTSFPYNGVAAYYLGLIQLQAGDLPGAISQWQNYVRIDPEGAKQKDVPRHLTLLITQQVKEEMQYAVANENRISPAPPEPNSIAVHPLVNRGDEKYGAIGKGITAMVIADIAKVPGVKVLEREKIQALLDELKLSEKGLVEADTAIRSGRLLRAEKLMIGDYTIEPGKGDAK